MGPMTLKEIAHDTEQELIAYAPLVRRLLLNRGIVSREAAEQFLQPSYERDVSDPFLMKHLETAVDRIYSAVKMGEKICIFADYDCDGIPGAVIWHDTFKKIGFENFQIYIPDRHKEGYGLNQGALDEIAAGGAKLVITVDLGITAVQDVEHGKSLGLEMIVTDHHLPQEKLPDTLVVNPKQPGDTYPDNMLCGSGVAYKVIQGFLKKHGSEFGVPTGWEKWLLDMVGMATLSDMVPLVKENRALAHFGLQVLRKTRRPGLLKAFSKTRIMPSDLVEDDITFSICPKLNAASRMDTPRRAFELLAAPDVTSAGAHADALFALNDERKLLVAHIMKSVKKAFASGERAERSVIVIGDPSWRVGVLGLVAGKIVDEYKKPAFVWGLEGGTVIKGSCRSDGSVNLVELMTALPEGSLLEFGGHEGAGGFSASHEAIHFLEERLATAHEGVKRVTVATDELVAEADIELSEVSEPIYRQIEQLAPFGVGNPKPMFRLLNIVIANAKTFGKTAEHTELSFEDEHGRLVKAITFFKTPDQFGPKVKAGGTITLFATMERSTFGRRSEVRLRIVEIR